MSCCEKKRALASDERSRSGYSNLESVTESMVVTGKDAARLCLVAQVICPEWKSRPDHVKILQVDYCHDIIPLAALATADISSPFSRVQPPAHVVVITIVILV